MTAKSNPALKHVAITPSDSTSFNPPLRSVFVGVAGTVTILDSAGTSAAYIAQAGQILPITATKVMATGTTATDMVGLY